jgi:hypothetical protein
LRVRDAEALHHDWQTFGVPTNPVTGSRLMGVTNTEYGLTEFALVDPNGNLLRIGSPLSEYRRCG